MNLLRVRVLGNGDAPPDFMWFEVAYQRARTADMVGIGRPFYAEPDLDAPARAALVEGWRAAEGHRAWVLGRDEAIDAGVYGPVVADEVRSRIGDVLIAARAGVASSDRREPNRQAELMIGQHGSLSDEETRVPLIRAGAYATA